MPQLTMKNLVFGLVCGEIILSPAEVEQTSYARVLVSS